MASPSPTTVVVVMSLVRWWMMECASATGVFAGVTSNELFTVT
jgi:hypothetical protein